MLVGAGASSQRFTLLRLSGFGFQALTLSDVDGPAHPAGAPNNLMRHRDDEVHAGTSVPVNDFLEIYELSVDFNAP